MLTLSLPQRLQNCLERVKEAAEFKEARLKARAERWYRCKESHCRWLDRILTKNQSWSCWGTVVSKLRTSSRYNADSRCRADYRLTSSGKMAKTVEWVTSRRETDLSWGIIRSWSTVNIWCIYQMIWWWVGVFHVLQC
jgi:hypothetical protein